MTVAANQILLWKPAPLPPVNMTMRTLVTILFLFVVSIQATVPAEDWPQFRGPGGQGHSSSKNLPLRWSPDTNVVWKRNLPGNGWSSPVLLQGRVYLTTAVTDEPGVAGSGGDISLRVLCLDAASGNVHWNTEVATLPAGASMHPKNSHASATPVVTSDRVYVHYASNGTAAFDLDGNPIWKKKIEYNSQHGTGSSPVLFEDLLIFNCDGLKSAFVIALDCATGQERWRTSRPDLAKVKFSFSTPLVIDVADDPQLVSAGSDLVCGYSPRTGKQLWMVHYPEKWSVVPRPVYAGGLILISTGYEGPAELLAIRPNGSGNVTETHVAWRARRFVPYNPSPIIHDGCVYLISDSGIASCRDLKTGDLLWKERVGGTYSASPLLAENRIYLMSEDGRCTVIRAAPEFHELARNDLEERSLASITPTDGALLIRTIGGLYRIGN